MKLEEAKRAVVDVDHLCDFSIDFEPTQLIRNASGTRAIYVVTEGVVSGERLNGEIVAGGGDWLIVGDDQIARLDVRATIRTDDGELIYVTNTGRADLRDGLLQRLVEGEHLSATEMYARSAPLFETGADQYAWLNSVVTIAFNGLGPSHVDYEIFEVR